MYWDFYPRARPLPKALPGRERKTFGEKWWSQRWLAMLDSFGWSNRLQRGKAYARAGMVKSLDISRGSIKANVKGSRPKPYLVIVNLKVLSKKEWSKIIDKMSSQAIFSSKLLSGEMPQNIEEVFKLTKLSLFPSSKRDIEMECSCPDWAVPCKHIAAVFYIIADNFDNDPFLLFKIRGVDKEELLEELRNKRVKKPVKHSIREKTAIIKTAIIKDLPENKPDAPLESCISNFWGDIEELKRMNFSISKPEVSCVILKRLGKPAFWESNMDFDKEIKSVYDKISLKVIEIAFNK